MTTLIASLIFATTISFTVPTQDEIGGPAKVRRVNAWFANFTTERPKPWEGTIYRNWRQRYGARAKRDLDGRTYHWNLPPWDCAPGDSCGARVSCADSAGNWARDTVIYFRIP